MSACTKSEGGNTGLLIKSYSGKDRYCPQNAGDVLLSFFLVSQKMCTSCCEVHFLTHSAFCGFIKTTKLMGKTTTWWVWCSHLERLDVLIHVLWTLFSLQGALEQMLDILQHVNNVMHSIGIIGFPVSGHKRVMFSLPLFVAFFLVPPARSLAYISPCSCSSLSLSPSLFLSVSFCRSRMVSPFLA